MFCRVLTGILYKRVSGQVSPENSSDSIPTYPVREIISQLADEGFRSVTQLYPIFSKLDRPQNTLYKFYWAILFLFVTILFEFILAAWSKSTSLM